MPRYSIAPDAQADLDDIWETIARDDVEAAGRVLSALRERFPRLADFPGLGRTSGYAPDLRRFAVPPYVIFYRPSESGIEVVRVLHGARNLARTLQDDGT